MADKQKQTTHESLKAYIRYAATFKAGFFITLISFIVARTLLAIVPIFVGRFVGALAAQPLDSHDIYFYATILIFCSIGHDFVWRLADLSYMHFILPKTFQFQDIIFETVIKRPYPYFVGKFTGKISSYASSVGMAFGDFMREINYNYIDMFVKLPTITIIMFTVNRATGYIFIASTILMMLVGRNLVSRTAEAERKATDVGSSMDGYSIDVIANFVNVKAFHKENWESQQVVRRRKGVHKAARNSYLWGMAFWGVMGFIVRTLLWPGTILLNTYLYIEGVISLEQITTFITAILIFSDYIWGVIWNISTFNVKFARTEEAYKYLFGTTNVVQDYLDRHKGKREALSFDDQLRIKDLTFAYPDHKTETILEGVHLDLKRNEKVGIVGKSGSGKTTLIKLLLGYYQLPGPTIEVDGQPVDNRRLVELISYVPQDTSLFHRSIRDNIAYSANQKVDQATVEQAAHRAHAHEFISKNPDGYDAVVGERGMKLSMGQRQRIAIARAFLDDKPILILDEATSALDSESEVLVQQALEDLWHDKTVIAIAHRLSTLRHMDRIIVLENGAIIEQGSHEELLEHKGKYYQLWQHQSNGMLKDDEQEK